MHHNIAVLGRFCPVHIGHVELIDFAIERSKLKPIILIGSCNAPISYRNMFNYSQRRIWLDKLYGSHIRICGVPDYPMDDATWATNLKDIVSLYAPPEETTFIGGSDEDLHYLAASGLDTFIAKSRFAGDHHISASEVRDALILKKDTLGQLVHHHVLPDILQAFNEQWVKLQKV